MTEDWDNEGGQIDDPEALTECPDCSKMVRRLQNGVCIFCWLKKRAQGDKYVPIFPGTIRRLGIKNDKHKHRNSNG